jgi:Spy/CpxP family protein refolding chaperone
MNRLARLILLVSLGLNLGLGWALWQGRGSEPPRPPQGERVGRERPAAGDTAAWRRMMKRRIERLSARLDLSAAQAEQLQALQLANGPLVRAQHERIEAARDQVRVATGAAAYDEVAVRAALASLRRAQADLDSLTQEFLLQECGLLTPAQRTRYLELLPLEPWRGGRPSGPPDGPDGPEAPDDRPGRHGHRDRPAAQ